MNKNIYFKLFSIVFLLLLIFPFNVGAVGALSASLEKEIQDAFFTECGSERHKIVFWSVAYLSAEEHSERQLIKVYRKDVLGHFGIDDPTLIQNAKIYADENSIDELVGGTEKIELSPLRFNVNSSGAKITNSKLSDFAQLKVERDGVLTCGKRTPGGYESCKGNDYCNYFCSKMAGEVQKADNVNGTPAYFLYGDDSDIWNNCNINIDDCKANRIFRGVSPYDNPNEEFYIGNSNEARSSIQSRSMKLYNTSCDNTTLGIKYMGKGMDSVGVYDEFERTSKLQLGQSCQKNGAEIVPYDFDKIVSVFGVNHKFSKKVGGGNYEFIQKGGKKIYATPIKFIYYLEPTDCKKCDIVENNNLEPPKNCTDLDNYTSGNPYKCNNTGETFNIINSEVSNRQINPYCYTTCNSTINSSGITSINNKNFKAGMGFDWNLGLKYEKSCTVKIKNIPSNVNDSDFENCFNESITGAEDIKLFIQKFKYGNAEEDLELTPNVDLSVSDSKIYYYENGIKKIGKPSVNKNVSQITYEYTSNNIDYTTNRYGCVLKPNGIAVSCAEVGGREHIINNTTYPIAFAQHPVSNVPITLLIDVGGKKPITKICHYNIENEIFGKEDPTIDCDDDGNCQNLRSTGIDIIYRPIRLNNPFPSINGGVNWENNNTNLFGKNWTINDVNTFILRNRNVNDNNVYNAEPLYHFELDLGQIRQIRGHNSDHNYNDYEFVCDEDGMACIANDDNILRDLNITGTCSNGVRSEYYTCADKPQTNEGGDTP